MSLVEKNQHVSLSYTLRDRSGTILEEAPHNNPITYLHGYQQILPELEAALEGKQVGERVVIELSSEEAFGPYLEELLVVVDRKELSHIDHLQVGFELELTNGRYIEVTDPYDDAIQFLSTNDPTKEESDSDYFNEEEVEVPLYYTVREIFEESVLLDGNHNFAGLDLRFELKVLDISPASVEEIENELLRFRNHDGQEEDLF